MRARLMTASSRVARVPRGDGRTILVALLLFALMALIAALFMAVVPKPLAERGDSEAPAATAIDTPAPAVVARS